MSEDSNKKIPKVETSALAAIIGVIVLFSGAVIVTLIAPNFTESTWLEPTTPYQVQMYEISDPNIYISSTTPITYDLQHVYHVKQDFTLFAFHESENFKIVAPPELEHYITPLGEAKLKLSNRLLFLRVPQTAKEGSSFNALAVAEKLRKDLQSKWEKDNPDAKEKGIAKPDYEVLELYDPGLKEGFAVASPDTFIENWVDDNFVILEGRKQSYHQDPGVIYVNNPREYRITQVTFGSQTSWKYDPNGQPIKDVEALKSHPMGFRSRAELISLGEHLFSVEGCWYCHTDQTRTLVQDVVLNGSDSYPAPPSSPNEYIYQKITFMGTKRNGPDLSRVGVKRPSRDWHKGHFWSPKTASKGSIMPAFRHFFDDDPRGTAKNLTGIPNVHFEAIFQYLMTKGTRITPPTQAWWLGKDPVNTKEIIEGKRRAP